MLATRRCGVLGWLATALVVSVLLAGCGTTSNSKAELAPGQGVSIADQFYRKVRPVRGEQIGVGNIRNQERDPHYYLIDRMQATTDANPDWFSQGSSGDPQRGLRLVFQDGSTLTLVPRPETVGPSAVLDHVVVTRPY